MFHNNINPILNKFPNSVLYTGLAPNNDLFNLLVKNNYHPVWLPLIKIQLINFQLLNLSAAITNIKKLNWLIFTSYQAVDIFFNNFIKLLPNNLDNLTFIGNLATISPNLSKKFINKINKFYLNKYFQINNIINCNNYYNSNTFAQLLAKHNVNNSLFVLAKTKSNQINIKLISLLTSTKNNQIIECYQTIPNLSVIPKLNQLLDSNSITWITFSSPSALDSFLVLSDKNNILNKYKIATIGTTTANAIINKKIPVTTTATIPTLVSLGQAIIDFDKNSLINNLN